MSGSGGDLPKRLNLGCGRDRRAGCLNVDARAEVAPDLALDLDRRPYPLPRNYFEHIYAMDVVEHLTDVRAFMEEVHELLVPGGVIEISTPHYSCANSFTDPTHRQHLGYFAFDYFTAGHQLNFYTTARFAILERLLVFHNSLCDRLVARFARRHPAAYERRLAWIWPAWFMLFKLRAIKEDRA
jgi:SAM-dependent methyltransferase